MRTLITGLALVAASGVANAQLSFTQLAIGDRTEVFNVANLPSFGTDTFLPVGALTTSQTGTITFTYLGQESGYTDAFHLTINNTHLFESNAVGTSISAAVTSTGYIPFSFEGYTGSFAVNGPMSGWQNNTSIGLIATNHTVTNGGGAGTYQFILGFDDSAGQSRLGDWDDFVVGVNFVATPTIPVPEPETYALLLAGLGLVGFAARRRKLQPAA